MSSFYNKQKATGGGALLSKAEISRYLGRSVDFVDANVIPALPNIVIGKRVYIARVELERWLLGQ